MILVLFENTSILQVVKKNVYFIFKNKTSKKFKNDCCFVIALFNKM